MLNEIGKAPPRVLLVFRGVAIAHLVAGLIALAMVATTPQLSSRFAVASSSFASVIVLLSLLGAWRPVWVMTSIYARPRELAVSLLALAVAANTAFGLEYGPLFGWSLCAIATGAGQLPGRSWLGYGLAGAFLTLIGTTLVGRVHGLAGDQLQGGVLLGALAGLVNAAFFGTRIHKIIQRLQRLELTFRQEGSRPAQLRAALPELDLERREVMTLIDDAERAAATLSEARGQDLLHGVAQSRRAIARSLDGQISVEGSGLRAMLALQLRAWSHLWTAGGMAYELSVSDAADEVAVDILRAVKVAVDEQLDNIHRYGAPGGLVRVVAEVLDDFLVVEMRNASHASPVDSVREGLGYGTSIAAAALRRVAGTIYRSADGHGGHSTELTVPLLRTVRPLSMDHLDLGSTNHAAQVAQWLSVGFRAFRCMTAIGMVASSALDLPDRQRAFGTPLAVVAVVSVELLFARAGLRGERMNTKRWAWAACAVAIVTSAVLPQADRYQSAPWAAMVLLELAWRGGWGSWIGGEVLRTAGVLSTMYLPPKSEGRAYAAQLLVPWLFGVAAGSAHRLLRPAYELQQQLGTASERFSCLQSFARSSAARHSVIAPLGESLDRLPVQYESLRARVDKLYAKMLLSTETADRLYPPQVALHESVKETLEAVVSVPVACLGFDAIMIPRPVFAGAGLDAYARRAAILDDVAAFAEDMLLTAVRPTMWGRRRLMAVVVEASQRDDSAVVLLVATVPRSSPSAAVERQYVLRSSSGVTVRPAVSGWEVTIEPHALA